MDRKEKIIVSDKGCEEKVFDMADKILILLKELSAYKGKQLSGKAIDKSILKMTAAGCLNGLTPLIPWQKDRAEIH